MHTTQIKQLKFVGDVIAYLQQFESDAEIVFGTDPAGNGYTQPCNQYSYLEAHESPTNKPRLIINSFNHLYPEQVFKD